MQQSRTLSGTVLASPLSCSIDPRINSLPLTKESKFDNELFKSIKTLLIKLKIFNSPQDFKNIMTEICLDELEKQISLDHILSVDEKQISKIIQEIFKSDPYKEGILKNYKANCCDLFEKTITILIEKNSRSTWSEKLLLELKKVQKLNPLEWLSFIQSKREKDKKIRKILLYALATNKGEQKQLLLIMELWIKNLTEPMLFPHFLERVRQKQELVLLPFQRIFWIEPPTAKNPLALISQDEVLRCFVQGSHVLFQNINVNGRSLLPFHFEAKDESEYQIAFFHLLFSTLDPSSESNKLLEQATLLIKGQVSNKIPCFPILQLCTLSAWHQAQECLMERFSGIFTDLRWTRALQGIGLNIKTFGTTQFTVTQTKNYKTYKTLCAGSKSVDKEKDLCDLTLSWTLSPFTDQGRKTWRGVFEIPLCSINGTLVDKEQRWQIMQTFLDGMKTTSSQEGLGLQDSKISKE
jgi:hypothetical protein